MIEIVFPALVCAVAAACYLVIARRNRQIMAFWLAALAASIGAGACRFMIDDLESAATAGAALATTYPALLLAGALAYAGRAVPWWMIPAAFAVGGLPHLVAGPEWLAASTHVAVAVPATLASALLVARARLDGPPSGRQRALPAAFVFVALLIAFEPLLVGPEDPAPLLLVAGWILATPLLLSLQVAAVADRVNQALRRTGRDLELRVEERTAELARSVAALRESEERYRLVSELSSDFSFCVGLRDDHRVEVRWMTAAVTSVTGYAPDEFEGAGWLQVVHPDDVEMASERIGLALAGETQSLELRVVTKSGETRWLAVRADSWRDEKAGATYVVGSAQNVTARKSAEEERRRMELHMQEVQRLESLGVLAGGIAHDFNNVLTVILGNCRLAAADLDAGHSPGERLARIEAAAEHAAALTSQMLTYSGRGSVALSPLDLSQLARDMLDLLRASVSEKCSLDVDLDGNLDPVEGDATQIRQVLLNLVCNASDALGGDDGRVCVRTRTVEADARTLGDTFGTPDPMPGRYVCLEVSDDGAGMDESRRARIFEPFFTTKDSGRGLGLAAVLGIVSAHGGVIEVDSEPGAGTTFRVLIPRAGSAARRASRPEPAVEPAGVVLAIDRDPGVLELYRESLERAGFDVLAAADEQAGLELFRWRANEVDVVVLDVSTSQRLGAETFDEIRRVRPGVPVVLAGGHEYGAPGARYRERGVAAFLVKPFGPEEIVVGVREALRAASR